MKHYVWDGRRIRAVEPAVLRNGETRQDRLSASLAKFRSAAYDAIFPNPRSVWASMSVAATPLFTNEACRAGRTIECVCCTFAKTYPKLPYISMRCPFGSHRA